MAYVKDTGEHDRNKRIIWFAIWNVFSFAVMAAMFIAVRDLDALTGPFDVAFRFFFKNESIAVLAALSPFVASMLVGYGYAMRARKRKQAEAEARLREAVG